MFFQSQNWGCIPTPLAKGHLSVSAQMADNDQHNTQSLRRSWRIRRSNICVLQRRWRININQMSRGRSVLDASRRVTFVCLHADRGWKPTQCAALSDFSTHVAQWNLKDALGRKCAGLSQSTHVSTDAVFCQQKAQMAEAVKFILIFFTDARQCHSISQLWYHASFLSLRTDLAHAVLCIF